MGKISRNAQAQNFDAILHENLVGKTILEMVELFHTVQLFHRLNKSLLSRVEHVHLVTL